MAKQQQLDSKDPSARARKIYRVTLVGSISNFLLLVFKFVAGILGHSAAMIADAVHSLTDFITDIIVLLFVRISARPRDTNHQYGHGKFETLATSFIGMILITVGFIIFWNGATSVWRFAHGEPLGEPRWIALIAALVSVVTKEILFRYTIYHSRRLRSSAIEANAWHHRSDAFSSIATAVGIGGALLLGESWRVLDPISAMLVSLLIVKVAIELLLPAVNELLEVSLPEEVEQQIVTILDEFEEISDVHNLRTRRIGPAASIEMHLRMDGEMTVRASHEVTRQIEGRLRALLGPETYINIHVEPRN